MLCAYVLVICQVLAAPLVFLGHSAQLAAVSYAQNTQTTALEGGSYNLYSPSEDLTLMSGVTDPSGNPHLYKRNLENFREFSPIVLGNTETHYSDPSIVTLLDQSSTKYLYFTRLSAQDAASSTLARLNNHIGVAISTDGGVSWEDKGTLIGQANGIDARGAWSPGAVLTKDAQLWVYFSTNYPGDITVYRALLDQSGTNVIATERTYLIDEKTPKALTGFDVSVSLAGDGYQMVINKDFSSIYRYISNDGIHWYTDTQTNNPVVAAQKGSVVRGAIQKNNTIYFSGGSVEKGIFNTLNSVDMATLSTQASFSYVDAQQQLGFQTGQPSGSSSNAGGSGGMAVMVGVMGIAAIAGLTYLITGATAAGTTAATVGTAAVSSNLTGFSFGGRIGVVVPCVSALGPSLWVQLAVPASLLLPPYSYIWTPATMVGIPPKPPSIPPSHPGQEIKGRFDIPYVCFTYSVPPIPLYGLRMQTEQVSAI